MSNGGEARWREGARERGRGPLAGPRYETVRSEVSGREGLGGRWWSSVEVEVGAGVGTRVKSAAVLQEESD